MKKLLLLMSLFATTSASAQYFTPPSAILTNGTTAHAADIMTDFNAIIMQGNAAYNILAAAIAALPGGSVIQPGAIVNFNGGACPAGYVATAALAGTFPRGWDAYLGVDPGRGLGTYQASQIQSHTHSGSGSGVYLFSSGAAVVGAPAVSIYSTSTASSFYSGSAGGSDTYPPYTPAPFCTKS